MSSPQETPADAAVDTEVQALAAERLTFFSDAVIAIALTLLALELPVPDGETNHDFWQSALDHRGEYIAFVISFVVIAARWRGHHDVFRYVHSVGGKLSFVTMYWLLLQVITPFATKVLTGDAAFESRFIIYASVQALAFLTFMAMVWQVEKHGLARPDTPEGLMDRAKWRSGAFAGAFLVSIPIALFTTYAYVAWIAVPLLGRVVRRIRESG